MSSRSSARRTSRSVSSAAEPTAVRSSSALRGRRRASSSSALRRASGVRSSWLASATKRRSCSSAASSRVEHLVERRCQVSDLVVTRRHGEPRSRCRRGDGARPAAHRLDGTERCGRQEVAAERREEQPERAGHDQAADEVVERLLRLAERVRDDEHAVSVRGPEGAPAVQVTGPERDRRQDTRRAAPPPQRPVRGARGARPDPIARPARPARGPGRPSRTGARRCRAASRPPGGRAIPRTGPAGPGRRELRSASSTRRYTKAPSARSSAAMETANAAASRQRIGTALSMPLARAGGSRRRAPSRASGSRTAGRSSRGGSGRRRRRRSSGSRTPCPTRARAARGG